MTERTEGIKEGLEMAAKFHDEQCIEWGESAKNWRVIGMPSSANICQSRCSNHRESAEILRAKIEEVE